MAEVGAAAGLRIGARVGTADSAGVVGTAVEGRVVGMAKLPGLGNPFAPSEFTLLVGSGVGEVMFEPGVSVEEELLLTELLVDIRPPDAMLLLDMLLPLPLPLTADEAPSVPEGIGVLEPPPTTGWGPLPVVAVGNGVAPLLAVLPSLTELLSLTELPSLTELSELPPPAALSSGAPFDADASLLEADSGLWLGRNARYKPSATRTIKMPPTTSAARFDF